MSHPLTRSQQLRQQRKEPHQQQKEEEERVKEIENQIHNLLCKDLKPSLNNFKVLTKELHIYQKRLQELTKQSFFEPLTFDSTLLQKASNNIVKMFKEPESAMEESIPFCIMYTVATAVALYVFSYIFPLMGGIGIGMSLTYMVIGRYIYNQKIKNLEAEIEKANIEEAKKREAETNLAENSEEEHKQEEISQPKLPTKPIEEIIQTWTQQDLNTEIKEAKLEIFGDPDNKEEQYEINKMQNIIDQIDSRKREIRKIRQEKFFKPLKKDVTCIINACLNLIKIFRNPELASKQELDDTLMYLTAFAIALYLISSIAPLIIGIGMGIAIIYMQPYIWPQIEREWGNTFIIKGINLAIKELPKSIGNISNITKSILNKIPGLEKENPSATNPVDNETLPSAEENV